VISMGGMLDKLVANGNAVTVAYMTNGSVAVFDADVRRALRFVDLSHDVLGITGEALDTLRAGKARILDFLSHKRTGEIDLPEVQAIKAHIRYAEAIAGIEVLGLGEAQARFLDMPFYKTGMVRKAPIGEADIEVVLGLLNEVRPDHIFVAGDLSDPHGTHRMCYVAIKEALVRYNKQHQEAARVKKPVEMEAEGKKDAPKTNGSAGEPEGTFTRPLVWLYRGAWQEWPITEATWLVPMSQEELRLKIQAIFKHQSQKDSAPFPGQDEREFWQRVEQRNKDTAAALNQLGLAEYFAMEAYVVE
jgi:glucosamine-6-phosphate deaminase